MYFYYVNIMVIIESPLDNNKYTRRKLQYLTE